MLSSKKPEQIIALEKALNIKIERADRVIIHTKNEYQINEEGTLEGLSLANVAINDSLDFGDFSKLKTLYLVGNQLKDINFLGKMTCLETLRIQQSEISEIDILKTLTHLEELIITDTAVTNIGVFEFLGKIEHLQLDSNKIEDFSPISYCKELRYLFLRKSNIRDVSFIGALKNLRLLDLSKNEIIDFTPIANLKNLSHLTLNNTGIEDLGFLLNLDNLIYIALKNNQIKDISALKKFMEKAMLIVPYPTKHKYEIILDGNPLINPPMEIVEQGNDAVLNYWKGIESEGSDIIHEVKVSLLGQGAAGKTSLQLRLKNPKAELPHISDRTSAISIVDWEYEKDNPQKQDDKSKHIAHIWDFAGQEIDTPVHRFFLTKDSVYVLVGDTKNVNSHKFEYWIPTIYQFGDNSPILLVQTLYASKSENWKLGDFTKKTIYNIIRADADYVYHRVNLPVNNFGLEQIKQAIIEQIRKLPDAKKRVQKSWILVRELLEEQRHKNCIALSELEALITNPKGKIRKQFPQSFQTNDDITTCLDFFKRISVILWFKEHNALKQWVILNPKWAVDAVYNIIEDNKIGEQFGVIQPDDFKRIWKEARYAGKDSILKDMLEEFKIAFPKQNNKNYYLLPARLKDVKEEEKWTNDKKYTRLQFKFDFMPKGVLAQISADLSSFIIADDQVWNDAVNLKQGDAVAQVFEDYTAKKIYIKAQGRTDTKGLIMRIAESVEIITAQYKGVEVDKSVPCSCYKCIDNEDPFIFNYKDLVEGILEDETGSMQCNKSRLSFNMLDLLTGLGFANPKNEPKYKINAMQIDDIKTESKIINNHFHAQVQTAISGDDNFNLAGNQLINPQESSKEKSKTPLTEIEKLAVTKWKNKSLLVLVVSLILTFGLVVVYIIEPEGVMSVEEWKTIKESDWIKWLGLASTLIWNSIVSKLFYDRFYDASKENSFIDLYRKKNSL